jgi:hypothetical protein
MDCYGLNLLLPVASSFVVGGIGVNAAKLNFHASALPFCAVQQSLTPSFPGTKAFFCHLPIINTFFCSH